MRNQVGSLLLNQNDPRKKDGNIYFEFELNQIRAKTELGVFAKCECRLTIY